MPSYPLGPLGSRFSTTLQAFAHDPGLPFAQALPEEHIDQVARAEGLTNACDPGDVYTPAVTLGAFLAQVKSGRKSCVAAVARVLVLRVALGLPPCSANTGAYGKARAKLSETFLRRLTYDVGAAVEDQAPDRWRWHGHRVLVADGCLVTLPDTPANQQAYPQPGSQKPGLGFPMIRLVVLLTFATASLVGAAKGPHQGKETGATALFRQLLDRLRVGDVVVADRYSCSSWMIALLPQQGVAAAFRLHQRRHYDFRRGRRLGRGDHVVRWAKPERPAWLDAATYAALPDALEVRAVRFAVTQPGYRTAEVIVATTRRDADVYRKDDIADLYHRRWHVELDSRAIKQTLRMDQLSCKTPALVRRALWMHLLGYNLVRKVLAEAAWQRGRCPRQLSNALAVQTLEAFRWLLLCSGDERRRDVYQVVLVALATHGVGDRPGRCEPRAVKRRPKEYDRLTKPRAEARAALLGGQGQAKG